MTRVLGGPSFLIFAVLVCLGFSQAAAEGEDKRTPLERYRGDTNAALVFCSMKFEIAVLSAQAGATPEKSSDFRGCIGEENTKTRDAFNRALWSIKKPKAQDALKNYHVAFVTALRGIEPLSDERKISYQERQGRLRDKVIEAWARFEVEQ